MYLGFWGLDFEILMEKVEKHEKKNKAKQEEKIDCLQGGQSCFFVGPKGLGETLAIFFFDVLGRDGKSNERHREKL